MGIKICFTDTLKLDTQFILGNKLQRLKFWNYASKDITGFNSFLEQTILSHPSIIELDLFKDFVNMDTINIITSLIKSTNLQVLYVSYCDTEMINTLINALMML